MGLLYNIDGGCHNTRCEAGACDYRGVCQCNHGYDGRKCEECSPGFARQIDSSILLFSCTPCIAHPAALVGTIIGFIILAALAAWLSDLRIVRDMSIPLRTGTHHERHDVHILYCYPSFPSPAI